MDLCRDELQRLQFFHGMYLVHNLFHHMVSLRILHEYFQRWTDHKHQFTTNYANCTHCRPPIINHSIFYFLIE